MFMGNGPAGGDTKYKVPNHSPVFDTTEPNLETGARVLSDPVVDYQQK